ncbi:hypothetical protein CAOG_09138 [Capsaspora owczarzaki ATCC 30864]|nr:hypothetical protein CAOG_09138 [Capsaspora owczarzaki ATCC 30864]|eukprot:XP_011270848.1 hypothetical protein CAOG_09138 [Capsaspora owczarzaki ATCC 30864]
MPPKPTEKRSASASVDASGDKSATDQEDNDMAAPNHPNKKANVENSQTGQSSSKSQDVFVTAAAAKAAADAEAAAGAATNDHNPTTPMDISPAQQAPSILHQAATIRRSQAATEEVAAPRSEAQMIEQLPEGLQKSFEREWQIPALRTHLLQKLVRKDDDDDDDDEEDVKAEIAGLHMVLKDLRTTKQGGKALSDVVAAGLQKTKSKGLIQATKLLHWADDWLTEQGDSFLSARFEPGGMPDVPEFPIRRRAVEDRCLNLLQLSIQGLQYPSRGHFPLWQMISMRGMGKTSFGVQLLSMLSTRLEEDTCELDRDEKLLVSSVLKNPRRVYIDFNGLGDAISSPDHDPKRSLLAPRLVARAELGTSIKIARFNAAFCAAEPNFNGDAVLNRIFAAHRAKNHIRDDEVALLFIHVDEVQLAHEALVLELQRNAREDFIKNSTRTKEQVESYVTSPAAIADFKLKASDRFKTEVARLLNYNFSGRSLPNLVVLLFTGTGDAGVRFQPNQNGIMPLDLEPLSQEDSLAFVQRSARSTTPWHSDWFQDPAFQRLVADLGGSPQLLAALVASRPKQLSRPPGAPAAKNKVLFEVALSFLQTESVIKHNRDLSSSVALRMLWLTMTHTYVPPDYVMNPTTGETVQDLAETGGATLVRKVADHVGLRVPIVLLRPILAKIPVAERAPILDLFTFPYQPNSGRAFELGLVATLAIRFGQQVRPFTIHNLFGISPDVPLPFGSDSTQSLEAPRTFRTTAAPVLNAVQDTSPFVISTASKPTFDAAEAVDAVDIWMGTKVRVQADAPGVVFLHAASTSEFDARLVLESMNDDERPLLILLQATDEDLPKKGDAANRTAKLFKAYSAIRNSTFGSKFDIVLCVVTSTTLTMSCRKAWQIGLEKAATNTGTQAPPLWMLDPNDAAPLMSTFRHATVVSDPTSASVDEL